MNGVPARNLKTDSGCPFGGTARHHFRFMHYGDNGSLSQQSETKLLFGLSYYELQTISTDSTIADDIKVSIGGG